MTVCIAAAGRDLDGATTIALCADRKVASVMGSAETAFKHHFLAQGWMLSLAGDDDADIIAIARNMGLEFAAATTRGVSIDESNVAFLITEATMRWKIAKRDQIIANEWGLTYSEFVAGGQAAFTEALYSATMRRISEAYPKVSALVTGFSGVMPMFLEYHGFTGQVVMRDEFAVVGSGAHIAQGVFLRRVYQDLMSTKQVLYIAFEAKRFAEAEPNVGKETIICVQRQDKTVSYVSHKGTLFLQKQYDEQNPSDRPGPEDLPDNCFRKPTDIS